MKTISEIIKLLLLIFYLDLVQHLGLNHARSEHQAWWAEHVNHDDKNENLIQDCLLPHDSNNCLCSIVSWLTHQVAWIKSTFCSFSSSASSHQILKPIKENKRQEWVSQLLCFFPLSSVSHQDQPWQSSLSCMKLCFCLEILEFEHWVIIPELDNQIRIKTEESNEIVTKHFKLSSFEAVCHHFYIVESVNIRGWSNHNFQVSRFIVKIICLQRTK